MKKVLMLPMLALAFVASALSASAWYVHPTTSTLEVENHSHAMTLNNLFSRSNTGANTVMGNNGSATLWTGAAGAQSFAQTQANMSTIEVSAPVAMSAVNTQTDVENHAMANTVNNITSRANSGRNFIGGNNGPVTLGTGNALSSSEAVTMVNSSTIRVNR